MKARVIHDLIVKCSRDGHYAEAEQLLKRMPIEYRAVMALLQYTANLRRMLPHNTTLVMP